MHRRKFLTAAAVAATPLPAAQPVRFGIDLFSIRSQGWTPFQYLDYCAKWKAKVVHFSEIRFIGNLEEADAISLLRNIAGHLSLGDKLLLGVDLVKNSDVISAAYNDSAGITASFNKNLLLRINRELGGHFEPDAFSHVSFWNGPESRVELHLESLHSQSVRVDALDTTLNFYQGERIHTENSYKYTLERLETLLQCGGFQMEHTWTDPDCWFTVSLSCIT